MKFFHYVAIAASVGIGVFAANEIRGLIIARNVSQARIQEACTPHRRKGGMRLSGVLEQAQAVPELPEIDSANILRVNQLLDVGLS